VFRIARHALRILDLNKSIETNPRQAVLFKERASEYSRLGNYEQAIADYNSFLAIQPEDASVLHLRGLAFEQIGQSERATKDYQQAFAADPQLSNVYIDRGVSFGKMGQFRQSIDSLTEGIRLAPQNPNGYFNRGATYLQQGDFESAIVDFSRVIQLTSNDEDAYYWRGISHEAVGHQREAIADYEQFLLLSQNPPAREEIEQKLNQWKIGSENSMSNRSTVPDEKGISTQVPTRGPDQDLDLYDLLLALGEHAINSTWFGSSVDCRGENTEKLYTYTDNNRPIQGRDLLDITSGIHQTLKGDFTGFDPDAPSHWVFIHAWDGSGFYIEINDPEVMKSLKTHFPSIERVEDTPAPYEGLFIPI
jgi:tetratricopeptide (TPR) repeat protein